jgi:hypothetical protein
MTKTQEDLRWIAAQLDDCSVLLSCLNLPDLARSLERTREKLERAAAEIPARVETAAA